MRVVSFGLQTWGFSTREALIDPGHEVALAVAHPAGELSYKAIFSQPVGQPTERVDAATIDLVERVPRPAVMSSSCAGGYLNDRA
jgi:methionyl-tRNA formyltransferase